MAANKEHEIVNQDSGKNIILYHESLDMTLSVKRCVESYLDLGLQFETEDNGGIFFAFEYKKSQELFFKEKLRVTVTVDPSNVPDVSRYSFSVREVGNVILRENPEKFQQLEKELKEVCSYVVGQVGLEQEQPKGPSYNPDRVVKVVRNGRGVPPAPERKLTIYHGGNSWSSNNYPQEGGEGAMLSHAFEGQHVNSLKEDTAALKSNDKIEGKNWSEKEEGRKRKRDEKGCVIS